MASYVSLPEDTVADVIVGDNSTNEPTPPKQKIRRGRIILYSILGTLVLAGGVAAYAYYTLRPTEHFKHNKLPVVAQPTTANTGTNANNYPPLHDGEFNLLLLGVDSRAQNQAARSDSIVIVHVDLVNHDYEVLSIPRDTRVDLPGYGYTKITHANYMGELKGGLSKGTKDAIQAISNLTGLQINYYAETDYWGLRDIVDAVGGINVNLPFDVRLTHAWYPGDNGKVFKQGEQFLDGKMVTEIVHERYSLAGGEFDRQRLQEEALVGIAKAVLKPSNVLKIPTLVDTMSKYLTTSNMNRDDMLSLGFGVKDFSSQQVHYYQVPGNSAMMMDPIVGQKLYYWIPDLEGLNKIIQDHFTK
jgi:LCP family protein required for cell wall assembly